MKKCFWKMPIIGLVILGTGCAITPQPQTISITSQPPKASVWVGKEYVGDTPTVYKIKDINKHDSLVVKVEKPHYQSAVKKFEKENSKGFPKQQHFVLQPLLRP